jgi:hypothetical protein
MSNINRITNSLLPDRLYGEHYPDSFLDMPGPIRSIDMGRVDNNGKYMCKEHIQPNQSNISTQSSKPNSYSDCAGGHHAKRDYFNADPVSGRDPRSAVCSDGRISANDIGNIRCPENGKLCHTSVCRDECGEWLEARDKERQERRERNK